MPNLKYCLICNKKKIFFKPDPAPANCYLCENCRGSVVRKPHGAVAENSPERERKNDFSVLPCDDR